MEPVKFLPLGDCGLCVEFSRDIDPLVNEKVLNLETAINLLKIEGLVEILPTYRSLMVHFNPLLFDLEAFKQTVLSLSLEGALRKPRRWKIPVVYGGELGIDLEEVASTHSLSVNEVIRLHSEAIYRVYMLGFLPGFALMGGLNEKIATPRRLSPRLVTPAGTISIGGIQALVGSVEAPSGWHLLGRTPMRNYMKAREKVFLIEAGDEVTFTPIDKSKWEKLDKAAENHEWVGELI